jgi:hypothetical protein
VKKELPLKTMLQDKGDDFSTLFIKVMNLHLGIQVSGKPLSDKDRMGRIAQWIKESITKD